MKKIGLLTHPLTSNFGGILQASVLYNYLRDLGFQVVLIQKYPSYSVGRKVALKLLGVIPLQNIKNIRASEIARRKNLKFIDAFIPNRSPRLYTTAQLRNMLDVANLDAIIVGSDQVWRMKYIDDGYFGNYFLDFAQGRNIRRVAYAASFGSDHWEAPDKVDAIKSLITKFHSISTREVGGVRICKETFDCAQCEVVLDPTLLVEEDFYNRYFESPIIRTGASTIATYILDAHKNKERVVDVVCQHFGSSWKLVDAKGEPGQHDVAQWLRKLIGAEFIVTDSFHGMALSIAFKKQFIVIGNSERGLSRFSSLLDQLNLTHRMIRSTEVSEITKLADEEINYKEVSEKLTKLRKTSAEFLLRSLTF